MGDIGDVHWNSEKKAGRKQSHTALESDIGCPGSDSTNHIALGGIRPNSFLNITCVMIVRFRFSKTIIPQGGFL
jgi:hypothetical protein